MVRVLHFSPHAEDCGIAKYQEHYFTGMDETELEVTNEFFEYSPYATRVMDNESFGGITATLRNKLVDFDILHIQHEFGFFRGNQLSELINTAKSNGKRVVVTFHTSPDLIIIPKPLGGLGPRSVIAYLRSKHHNRNLANIHIAPLMKADKVLVHNQYTLNQMLALGVSHGLLELLPHPTYPITKPQSSSTIANEIGKKNHDIIIATIGYIHRFKGIDKAIKALCFLPDNYKLAVLGGVKSDSDDQELYDKLTDLILKYNLSKRVYISGVIPNDDDLNSYIRESDICIYPYNSAYYKGVSSGALNLAIANERPVIAYPVSTFVETNTEYKQLVFTKSDSYYELAREIKAINIKDQASKIIAYADSNSFKNMSTRLFNIYQTLI